MDFDAGEVSTAQFSHSMETEWWNNMKTNIWQNSSGTRSTILIRTGIVVAALGLINGVFQLAKFVWPQADLSAGFQSIRSVDYQDVYQLVTSLLVIAIPVALSWYARNYMKSAESQKRIGVISSLANTAINYAEDCDQRGERELAYNSLNLPASLSNNPTPANQKLYLASDWLAQELKRMGIKRVSPEEATRWVGAEYQKNMGGLQPLHSVSALTDLATDLIKQLGRNGNIKLPANTLDAVVLIQSIADWAASQAGDVNNDKALQRDAVMARISPSSLMMTTSASQSANKISPEIRLTLLARRATEFVAELQKQGKLRMPDKDTAKAWIIQQAQLDDIPVTLEAIDNALAKAFDVKNAS